jgi:hypothetical protein
MFGGLCFFVAKRHCFLLITETLFRYCHENYVRRRKLIWTSEALSDSGMRQFHQWVVYDSVLVARQWGKYIHGTIRAFRHLLDAVDLSYVCPLIQPFSIFVLPDDLRYFPLRFRI